MTFKLLAAAAAVALAAPALGANLVTNGSFETGSLSGWNVNGWFAASSGYDGNPAGDGNFFASTGCVGTYCSLSQDITTTPGATYTLSFVFNPGPDADSGQGDTQVFFGGNQVVDLAGGAQGNTAYTFSVTASTATSTLLFTGYQNPAYNEVDAVSLTSAVPEPATWALMIGGFGLVGASLRRRTAALAA